MLDVRRLRLLRELALRGTIAAVAEALAFTPSAVSQQLSALEREAGLPLLERTGRRVTLTPAGKNLARHAETVLECLERAAAELVDARQGLAGPLRIGTFPTAARVIVLAALTDLARQHPGLVPMVSEIDPAGVAHALRAGELDVALIHDYDFLPAHAEPGLATQPLCTESMYLASLGATSSTINQWKDAPWITATPGTLCHTMTLRACQAAGFTPQIRHQVDDFAMVLDLVAAGQGVALVPQLAAVNPPPAVTLTRVPLSRRTEIAVRSGSAGHPAVAAVVGALRHAVPEELRSGPEHRRSNPCNGTTRNGVSPPE
jgi:DNA-binding transcriptional LysR family regulator